MKGHSEQRGSRRFRSDVDAAEEELRARRAELATVEEGSEHGGPDDTTGTADESAGLASARVPEATGPAPSALPPLPSVPTAPLSGDRAATGTGLSRDGSASGLGLAGIRVCSAWERGRGFRGGTRGVRSNPEPRVEVARISVKREPPPRRTSAVPTTERTRGSSSDRPAPVGKSRRSFRIA